MSTPDSRWLDAIDKVSWWVLAGIAVSCWITLGFRASGFLTIRSSALWILFLAGALPLCLLIARGIDIWYKILKERPCKFSKLTKEQQEFLIGQVKTGDRFIYGSDEFSSQHWYKELRDLNYIGSYDHISRRGWKKVEEHMKFSKSRV